MLCASRVRLGRRFDAVYLVFPDGFGGSESRESRLELIPWCFAVVSVSLGSLCKVGKSHVVYFRCIEIFYVHDRECDKLEGARKPDDGNGTYVYTE